MAISVSKKKAVDPITIVGNGKYPLVPLKAITIVERPEEGMETQKLFYNPRGLASFTAEKMDKLQYSIRADGIQQPPVVRAVTEGKDVVSVELIAGERRIRSCRAIFENDLPCFDEDAKQPKTYASGDVVIHRGRFGTVHEQKGKLVLVDFEADHIGKKEQKECLYDDVFPTVPGSQFFAKVACKVVYDCTDQRALRLAFTENDQSEPLTISEEVALVERLERSGLKQEEIAELLGSNVTWVSQTSNFRAQLPAEAFQKLILGEMSRHVAVNFLSYAPEDREALFIATVKAEEEDTAAKLKQHRDQIEKLEDEEEIHMLEARKAEADGDEKLAAREVRKATSVANKADKEAERMERAKKEKGTLKQGHVKAGAAKTGLLPRKTKSLDRDEIESVFVAGMGPFLDGEVDEVSGQPIPRELAAMVRRTALAIIHGQRDPIAPIREYLYDNDVWEKPQREGVPKKPKSKGKGKVNNELTDFDVDGGFDPSIYNDDDFDPAEDAAA